MNRPDGLLFCATAVISFLAGYNSTSWNLSYQNINSNKSHQKCRKTAVQILFVLIKAKLKIQLNSKTVINPPPVNAEMKVPH